MSTVFPACHGIGVTPASLGLELGWLLERPTLEVEIDVLDAPVERAPDAELVWELHALATSWLPEITAQAWEEPGGGIWVGNTFNLSLRVDVGRSAITIAAKGGSLHVILQSLASVALPLVAQAHGSGVLHACAASRGGSAVLVCAEGGSGKSSLLMGLVAAGWGALSEDQCVTDVAADGRHRVWPGPGWARLKQDSRLAALNLVRDPRFGPAGKDAWDLREQVAHLPATLERVVLLEPSGGNESVWEPLGEAELIGSLTKHATWIRRADAYAPAVLPGLVKLGMSVPGFRLRLPRRADWLEHAVELITDGV